MKVFSSETESDFPVKKAVRVIDDEATGEIARELRLARGFSLRELGDAMGFSAMYLSQLERGVRRWTESLASKYIKAVNEGEQT